MIEMVYKNWLILLSSLVLLTAGPSCDKKPVKPVAPSKVIKLRVVMLVEPGAPLNQPLDRTGGCNLTKQEVKNLVAELVAFGNNIPGLKFVWVANDPEILEASCMKVQPPPVQECKSMCGNMGIPETTCPRKANITWFVLNVVGQDHNTNAGLLTTDNYDSDPCTINIYFVGNVLDYEYDIVWGMARHPGNPGKSFVIINDGATIHPDDPARFTQLFNRKTLLHEVVSHWLTQGGHAVKPPPFSSSNWPCSPLLSLSGLQVSQCAAITGQPATRGTRILKGDLTTIAEKIQNCGGTP